MNILNLSSFIKLHVVKLAVIGSLMGVLSGCTGIAPPDPKPADIEGCTISTATSYPGLATINEYSLHCKNADHIHGVKIEAKFVGLTIEGPGSNEFLRLSGFPALRNLTLKDNLIKKLDLESLPKLDRLTLEAKNLVNFTAPHAGLESLVLCDMSALNASNLNTLGNTSLNLCGANSFDTTPLITQPQLYSLGISGDAYALSNLAIAPNVKYLSVADYTHEIDLSRLPKLKQLYLYGNMPDSAVLSNSSLTAIRLEKSNIKSLTVADSTTNIEIIAHLSNELTLQGKNVVDVVMRDSGPIAHFDIASLPGLENLRINDSQIGNLDITYKAKLSHLALENANFSHLTIENNPSLFGLEFKGSRLDDLQLGDLPQLTSLSIERSSLTELDLTNFNQLHYLYLASLNITQLDLSHNTELNILNIYDSPLTALDLSANRNLETLILNKNSLSCTSIKTIRSQFLANGGKVLEVPSEGCL